MKIYFYVLAAQLAFSSTVCAQTIPPTGVPDSVPVTGASSSTSSTITVRAEGLGNRNIPIEVNGRQVTTMESGQSYTGVFSPGRMRIAVPGGKDDQSVSMHTLPNEEYIFALTLVTTPGVASAFGMFGALASLRPVLTLKQRREIIAGLAPPATSKPQPPSPVERVASVAPATSIPSKDIQAAQQAVVTQPSNAQAWRELGKQYQIVGDADKAIRAYHEALRIEPRDLDTLEAAGAMYAKTGQRERVKETWERLEKIDKARAEKFFTTYVLP